MRNELLILSEIYGNVQRVVSVIKSRRLQSIGHCILCTGDSQPVKNLVLWQPLEAFNIGQGNRKTYINQMLEDLPGLDIEDITRAGNDRDVWRELIGNLNM